MSQPATKTRRRWYQFSLRTLLVVVTLTAGAAAAWHIADEPYRLQREAMEAITKLGGMCETEHVTGWVGYLNPFAQNVVLVNLSNSEQLHECIPYLARLPQLRRLEVTVRRYGFGDEQLCALMPLTTLQPVTLDLKTTDISDVMGLPHLTMLYASDPPDDEGPMLYLALDGTKVTDDVLIHLQRSKSLRRVFLYGAQVTDKGIPHLAKCTQLAVLDISLAGISPSGVERLKAALPKCDIQH